MDGVMSGARWASFGFSLSARVRAIRQMRGLSQGRLAELTGLSRTLISNLERNQYNSERSADPTLSTVYRLAYGLRVPPALLLPAVGEEVGEMCWESLELGPNADGFFELNINWPVRPEDTQPFADF